MGVPSEDVDFRYPQVPEKPVDVPKPTQVEYRPLPELDRKYIPLFNLHRKRRTFKTPTNGEFYRSRSKRKILPHEDLSETEDDVTEDWLMIKHEEVPFLLPFL